MALEREKELARLSQADRHIAEAEHAITRQTINIERLREAGHDTKAAEHTLKGFENSLEVMHQHREQIVRLIEQIDQGLA
jgi:hypothetical protein